MNQDTKRKDFHTATIGLCTYQRPHMLSETLQSLSRLHLPDSVQLTLIIVDNDPDQSAKPVYDIYRTALPFPSHYEIEQRKGIVYARNKALDCANQLDTDLMLFIDDDEIVEHNWLIAHLTYYEMHPDTDVVTGPLFSIYPETTPPWIQEGGFFELQQDFEEDTVLKAAATNNVSFDYNKLYRQYQLHFDETLKSREDNDFFMAAAILGAKIRWTNTAIVHETVPLSKMTTSWLSQRAYKGGEAFAIREIKYRGRIRGRLIVMTRIPYYFVRGFMFFPWFLIKGYAYIVKSLQQFSTALGMIGGIFGTNYDDYQTIHGH